MFYQSFFKTTIQREHWLYWYELNLIFFTCLFRSTIHQKILRRPLVRPAPLRQIPISPIPPRRVPRDTCPEIEVFKKEGSIIDGCDPILASHIQDLVEQNPTCTGHSTPIPSEYNQTSPTSSPKHNPTGGSTSTYLSIRYFTNNNFNGSERKFLYSCLLITIFVANEKVNIFKHGRKEIYPLFRSCCQGLIKKTLMQRRLTLR